MKNRCSNPKCTKYADYGGRGIKVCDRWNNSFENFLADMGECPDRLKIERMDNDKAYEPTAPATRYARDDVRFVERVP